MNGLKLVIMMFCVLGIAQTVSAQARVAQTHSLAWKGTPIHVTVWAKNDIACEAIYKQCKAELDRLEQQYASYRQGSMVNRLNQYAGQRPVNVDDETLQLLNWAGQLHTMSQGVYDITSASYLWQYGFGQEDYRVPNDLRLAQYASLVNFNYIEIMPKEKEILFRKDGMQIEFDSLMVNHVFRRLKKILKKTKSDQSVRLSFGNNIFIQGTPPQGDEWKISLPIPGKKNAYLASLSEKKGSLLVADIYEHSFEEKGKRYHRYLDAKTGQPSRYNQAVYIWRSEKMKKDLPAGMLILLPAEKAIALVDTTPGTECLIIGQDKTIYLSNGWKKTLKPKFP